MSAVSEIFLKTLRNETNQRNSQNSFCCNIFCHPPNSGFHPNYEDEKNISMGKVDDPDVQKQAYELMKAISGIHFPDFGQNTDFDYRSEDTLKMDPAREGQIVLFQVENDKWVMAIFMYECINMHIYTLCNQSNIFNSNIGGCPCITNVTWNGLSMIKKHDGTSVTLRNAITIEFTRRKRVMNSNINSPNGISFSDVLEGFRNSSKRNTPYARPIKNKRQEREVLEGYTQSQLSQHLVIKHAENFHITEQEMMSFDTADSPLSAIAYRNDLSYSKLIFPLVVFLEGLSIKSMNIKPSYNNRSSTGELYEVIASFEKTNPISISLSAFRLLSVCQDNLIANQRISSFHMVFHIPMREFVIRVYAKTEKKQKKDEEETAKKIYETIKKLWETNEK